MHGPTVSAVVCTRNRSADIVRAVRSLLGNSHRSFEVVLVDQSSSDETAEALGPLRQDERLRYIRSSTQGKGYAANIGLAAARGEIVAFTDDDCEVPPDWLEQMERAFAAHPNIGLVFCRVAPEAHDPQEGYVPVFAVERNRIVRGMRGFLRGGIGIGAGMAARRGLLQELCGFDELLGPGSKFMSGEDHDIAIRVILRGYWIYEINDTAVLHYGFRSWQEGKELTRRDWFSMGATYIKPLLCGRPRGSLMLLSVPVLRGISQPISSLLTMRRPRGFGRIYYLLQGVLAGVRSPLRRDKLLYQ